MRKFGLRILEISSLCCCLVLFFANRSWGQNQGPAVGQWRSFLPYYQVNALTLDDENKTIYAATDYGFFSYNYGDGSLESYSKVNGMHDIGMSDVAFDKQTGTVLLAYKSGNIDLFKNQDFSNIPDLINSQVSGDKTIYAATCSRGIGYLSTGIGLILVNIPKREIKVTVPFFNGNISASVHDALLHDGKIYAATSVGLFVTDTANPFIQDYAGWDKLSTRFFQHLGFANGHLYAAESDSLFVDTNDTFQLFYTTTDSAISHLNTDLEGIWVSSINTNAQGHSYLLNASGNIIDSLPCHHPSDVLPIPGQGIWYADNSNYHFSQQNGLREKISATESKSYTPDGPISASSYDISAYDGTIWVAHGGHTGGWSVLHNRQMFSVYQNNHWKNFSWLSNNDWVQDFIRILHDPMNGHTYAGSMTGGLIDVKPDGSFTNYASGYLPELYQNPGLYNVSGLALDQSGNLWISSNGGTHELTLKTPDGQWYPMKPVAGNTQGNIPHSAADVIVDDYGQLWFITTQHNGVVVYNDNGTPTNTNDDQYRILKTGEGHGNLPSDNVLSIAKTKDGAIWIGTDNGIGIVNCPGEAISGQCEATEPVVQFDQYADYLFARQAVTAIAVDAGNREWVGTGNGVWLLSSASGEMKVVYRFTTDNSPLPSNAIRRINIDPITGDVYFSTDKGFIAFRSTATNAPDETTSDSLLIYPNPVPSEYSGMIAVRGLPDGADVRFTDISGKLVYRTTALGGEAVWNGRDYTGHKAESGVYLVFVVGKNGTKKETGKFIIQK